MPPSLTHWNNLPVPVKALLFDLGGVVFPIDFSQATQHWSSCSGVPADELRRRFRFDEAYQQLERGEISHHQYFDCLREQLAINVDDDQMGIGWNAIFLDGFPGADSFYADVNKRIPSYGFSNTNHYHHAHWRSKYAPLLSHFRDIFISCEIGLRKPEAEAFRHIAQVIDVALADIMFFDDTEENIAGALQVGMQAVHVKSFQQVERMVGQVLA